MNGLSFDLVVFDLDGVILSEEGYLDAAALTAACFAKQLGVAWPAGLADPENVASAADAAALRERFMPPSLVRELRARALNSNWDKALAAVLLFQLLRREGHANVEQTGDSPGDQAAHLLMRHRETGADLLEELLVRAGEQVLRSVRIDGSGAGSSPQWRVRDGGDGAAGGIGQGLRRLVVNRFQAYFLGDGRARSAWLRAGLATNERCMTDCAALRATLERLRRDGCVLGIGTGRPRSEAKRALQALGLWTLFEERRIVTIDEVKAEEERTGVQEGVLAKPHPFTFASAARGAARTRVLVVGDSPADLLAARAAGLRFAGIGRRERFPHPEYAEVYLPAAIDLADWLTDARSSTSGK